MAPAHVRPSPGSVALTLGFAAVLLLTAPLCVLLGLLLLAVSWPLDRDRRALHAFVCHWCVAYLRLNPGWHLEVEGRERLPKGAAVLVANHQSLLDIVAAMGLFHPFKFVSKVSLFRVPLLGWMMTFIRHVPLDRGRPHSTLVMLETCRGWLRRGTGVLFFPEGTYSDGQHMLPFRSGAFLLAIEEQVPLVPILIEGTRDVVVGDGPWLRPRAHMRVTVLEPRVPPKDADAEALAAEVRDMYERRAEAQRRIFGSTGRAR
jgi:1-acyl-sn-glycerol-3-phosphate acyltransferase